MGVYQFGAWNKRFAIDIESGNFFEVDKVSSAALKLISQDCSREALLKRLGDEFNRNSVARAINSLDGLKKKGMLFSPADKRNKNEKRKITDLTLNIVNTCNLKCRYCWNQAGSYGNVSARADKMKTEVAFKAVKLLMKEARGYHDVVVDFYGGEPLLNYGLIEDVIEYVKKTKRGRGMSFRFLLATNGTLLSKKRAEYLIENGVDIAVSLDGPGDIHDAQRPFSNNKGSFSAIMGNLSLLSKDYLKQIVARATFTPYSPRLVRIFKFLRKCGFERIEVCESEKAGYGLERNNRVFFNGANGVKHLKSLYNNLAKFYTREILAGRLAYKNTYFNRFFKQLSRLYHIQSVIGSCSAGFSLMAVDMDGSVYPCTAFVGLPRFRIGDVHTGIDENAVKLFSEIKGSYGESCSKCWAKSLCRGCGSCYNLNYFRNNDLSQPDPYYCELFRHKTKLMIAMISEVSRKSPGLLDKVLIPEFYSARGRRK